MEFNIEHFLRGLCSQVERIEASGPQDAFIVGDAKDAKIAYDVLVAYGFIAKLYQQQTNAKLYVGHARRNVSLPIEGLFAHAELLKNFKRSLDDFSRAADSGVQDFTMNFTNSVGGSQLGIYLNNAITSFEPETAEPSVSTPPPDAPARAAAPRNRYTRQHKEDTILSGPALTRESFFTRKEAKGQDSKTMSNLMSRFFVQNIASNTVEIFLAVLILAVIFFFLVIARGFVCPDIAHAQNVQWYCQDIYDPVEMQKYREHQEQLEKFHLKKDEEE